MIGKYLKKFFLSVSPVVQYQVSGRSMYPTFHHGQKIVVVKSWLFRHYKNGDIIVFKSSKKNLLILKRIKKIKNDRFYIIGDNAKESTDSRMFGWIEKKQTIGKVIAS